MSAQLQLVQFSTILSSQEEMSTCATAQLHAVSFLRAAPGPGVYHPSHTMLLARHEFTSRQTPLLHLKQSSMSATKHWHTSMQLIN